MSDIPDLTKDSRTLRVCKRPLAVEVVFAAQGGVCETLEGPVRYRAGDALLTGLQGERWPVRRDLFLAAYAPIPPTEPATNGRYSKLPSVTLALRLDHPVAVPVGWQRDPLQGHPGDWLLRYEDGSLGIISDAIFRDSYDSSPGANPIG